MSITTYAELKTAIQNWSKRSDTLSVLDDFIDLAESDIWQRLRIRDMEARATASTSTTSRYIELPTGFLQMRKLKLDRSASNLDDIEIKFETPASLPVLTSAGVPSRFTITSQIELDRKSDQVYTLEMQYFKSLTALSAAATSNAVLTRFPMIYLYASLFYYAQWAQDDVMLTKYASLAENAIEAANAADRRGRYGPNPGIRITGATP